MRDGRNNDPQFFSRMRGTGPWAELIRTRLAIAARKAGLSKGKITLRTDLFVRPVKPNEQMELF
jgi:hypothetical protein